MTREEAIEMLNNVREYTDDEAIDMAIEALQEVQKHEETFEWCHDCKEYDTDNHCCHRWHKVISNTVGELKADRPQGEWVEKGGELVCSVCGNSVSFSRTPKGWVLGKFCQSCGTRMKGGDAE